MAKFEVRRVPRVVWEIAVVLLGVIIALSLLAWSQRDGEKKLAAAQERFETELAAEQQRFDEMSRQLALSEAEAVARAFAAGIYPIVLAGRQESLDYSVGEVIKLPAVVFAHVLDPAGGVLATSDRKLAVSGEAGPKGDWALATEDFRARASTPEITEMALVVRGVSEKQSVLWIGYETGALLRRAGASAPPSEEADI